MAAKKNPLTDEALRLMDEDGLSAAEASRQLGLKAVTVRAAFDRRKLKWYEAREAGQCIHCGAPVGGDGKYHAHLTHQLKD